MTKVKHIALLKFKGGTPEDQIEKVFEEILNLTETLPGVEDYVSGSNSSPEGLNQGYTHGFVMKFESAEARDAYLVHPDHERVKAWVMPLLDSVLVFDIDL